MSGPAAQSAGARSETVANLLARAREILGPSLSSARLDAEVLLAHVLDTTRSRLHGWPEDPVTVEQARRYQQLIARRAHGEPVAYLTGVREFWSLTLEVSPHTLIPRPETETLVEAALGFIDENEAVTVADLGTGSGAVATAIASERPACQVIAGDACPRALAVAARNVRRHALANIRLRQGHWCEVLDGRRCAVIVCNPPYVASADPHLEQGDLRFEPRRALCAGRDGLDAIRQVIASAAAHLLPGGALVLEHGHDQGSAVRELFRQHGYGNLRAYRDLAGNDRVASGTL